MIRFFFKNHPKFSNQFVSQMLGVTLGRTDTFQDDNEFSSLSKFSVKLMTCGVFPWNWTLRPCSISKIVDLDSSEPWLRRTLTPDNRVVSVGWKISSWTRLGSSGFGFSSFSSSVAAPSLVLNVDFNTCEWNELYYKYIRRLRQNKESRLQLIHRATQSLGLLGSSWQFKRFIKWRQFLTRGRELKVMSQQQRWLSTTRVDKEQRQLNSRELARGWVIDRFKTISINIAHATSLKLLLIFQ